MSVIKKYWVEMLVFGAIFGVLLNDCLPQLTWINTDSDSAHYLLAAKYLTTSHNTSAPLFLLLSHMFLQVPFGSEAWSMGMVSVLATTVCSVLIYLAVKHHLVDSPRSRLFAVIAALIYGGSALVISQSTIIESYALVTMLGVAAYYIALRGKWVWASVFVGASLAIHPLLGAIFWAILLVSHIEMRKRKPLIIAASFFVFYLYVPLVGLLNPLPDIWGNTNPHAFFGGTAGMMVMLAGGLSMWDFPKRVLDTIGILGVSMGFGLVVLCVHLIRQKNIRSSLLWLFLIPVVYFLVNLASETYVYLMPAVAFGAVIVGIALPKMNIRVAFATLLVAVGLFAFNANYFDIGRTLDPNLSAYRFYKEELPKIGDGEIYLGGGWTWAICYLYNVQEGSNIIPICTDELPSNAYLDMIEANGIRLTRTDSQSFVDKQWLVAESIAEQNDNVWLARETMPAQYQYEIVPYSGNEELVTRWLGHEAEPQWRWKPSNPYDFITGAIEVGEWKFILMSNHNMRFVAIWMLYGFASYWFVERLFKRRKDVVSEAQEEDATTIG